MALFCQSMIPLQPRTCLNASVSPVDLPAVGQERRAPVGLPDAGVPMYPPPPAKKLANRVRTVVFAGVSAGYVALVEDDVVVQERIRRGRVDRGRGDRVGCETEVPGAPRAPASGRPARTAMRGDRSIGSRAGNVPRTPVKSTPVSSAMSSSSPRALAGKRTVPAGNWSPKTFVNGAVASSASGRRRAARSACEPRSPSRARARSRSAFREPSTSSAGAIRTSGPLVLGLNVAPSGSRRRLHPKLAVAPGAGGA